MNGKFADTSHHNSNIDFAAYVNAKYDRIAFKATEGLDYVDPTFTVRWNEARKYKLSRIAYHFLRNAFSGVQQADHFLKTVLTAGELTEFDTLVLDTEDETAPALALSCTNNFIERMIATGHKFGVIYSGKWYMDPQHMVAGNIPDGWRNLWVSGYTSEMPLPIGWSKSQVVAWQYTKGQYTNKAAVSGIPGEVDQSKILTDWLDMATVEEIEGLFKKYIIAHQTTATQDPKLNVHNLADVLNRLIETLATGQGNKIFSGLTRGAVAGDPSTFSIRDQLKSIHAKLDATLNMLNNPATLAAQIAAELPRVDVTPEELEEAITKLKFKLTTTTTVEPSTEA